MKHKGLIAALLLGTVLLATAAVDPVLMKINGKEIKLSEFEYLYHKNSQQQLEKETLEQYVDRFVTYKLKVADAEAAGIDTMPAFKRELEGYKADIIKPFLEDTTVKEELIQEAYQHQLTDVDIDHFMLPIGRSYTDNQRQLQLADSLRQCVLNGEDWENIATKYSVDPSVPNNKGHYGFIMAGMFPYDFEKVVYETPVGEISQPFKTNYGYHMLRVNAVRPNDGEVHVMHILKLFPRARVVPDSVKLATKHKIDSIYALLQQGADFATLAKAESEDPGSAKNGGELPWFGRKRMVPQFETVAYELKPGEMSEPFETTYGYHIVKKLDARMPSLDDSRKNIEQRMQQDYRKDAPRVARINQLKQQYNYTQNANLHQYLVNELDKHGKYDSTFVASVLPACKETLFTFANKTVPVSVLAQHLNRKATFADNETAAQYIEGFVEHKSQDEVMNYYADNIINDTPEFANLLNEYRDGMLLFEISNQRVWEAAGKDTLGLQKYFEANRDKYNWYSPRFKGIILNAINDSTLNAVKADIAALNGEPLDSITPMLHKKYGTNIKMERMLMGQGENKAIDYLFFNGPQPDGKYPCAMVLDGGLLYKPEGLNDVRGQVTSDYQDVLEKQWLADLKSRYPVKIDKKVLKKVK